VCDQIDAFLQRFLGGNRGLKVCDHRRRKQ
jgi:hypothetical protein